ncbi:hypothetical protein HDU97_006209 [Phlyctochytrium planicorne]|nr:hypothetical protein HDU97_006209 [Phlyctochytrium planicorne]
MSLAPAMAAAAVPPPPATFNMIRDNSTSLCWDANTLAIGAQVFLQECNPIRATQVFQQTTNSTGSILSVILSNVDKLCLEYSSKDRALALQKCANSNPNQILNLKQNIPTLSNDAKVCFGPSIVSNITAESPDDPPIITQLISTVDCKTSSPVTPVASKKPQYPTVPTSIKTMNLGNGCVDGSNITSITVTKCNGSPAQNWYTLFGQIRNVKNGLCLDAPFNWEKDRSLPTPLALTPCGGFPTVDTQLWHKTADGILFSSYYGNCLRAENGTLILGTQFCTSGDLLKGDNKFKNIETFFYDLGNPTCNQLRSRKDFRDLSVNEKKTFFNAMNTLHQMPSLLNRRNRYHDFVAIHSIGTQWWHGTPLFLPWHRYFIAVLERDLQTISGNSTFAFPYWAWDTDANSWPLESAGMLTKENFGTTSHDDTGCVTDGFMNGTWIPNNGPCLIRGYDQQQFEAQYTDDFLLLATSKDPDSNSTWTDFRSFAYFLEMFPHNTMHQNIAGYRFRRQSQMFLPSVSVNDPIFWMHHNNIDRYWQYFQRRNPKLTKAYDGMMAFPPGETDTYRNVSASDILPGFNVPVSKGMGLRSGIYCHKFVPYSKSIASVSAAQGRLGRRSDRFSRRSSESDKVSELDDVVNADPNVQVPKDLPVPPRPTPGAIADDFLDVMKKYMKVDKEKIRKTEANARKMMEALRQKTDAVLKEQFNKDVTNASFEQHAKAVKIAIAKMSA